MLQHAQIPNFTAVGIMPFKYAINHSFEILLRNVSGTENMEVRTFSDRLT
jgi:hypothetical protein